ncbi:hypothetical protein [Humibacter sp. RRB41]|nr:hypothetical protein [Humibacter sp. RRB41]
MSEPRSSTTTNVTRVPRWLRVVLPAVLIVVWLGLAGWARRNDDHD